MADALTYFAARDEDPVGRLLGSAAVVALAQSGLLIAIGFLLEPLVLDGYGHAAIHSAELMLVGFVPASLVGTYMLGVLNGRQRLIEFQALRGLVMVMTAAALTGEWLEHALTVRNAVYAYIGANVFMVFVLALVVLRLERPRLEASRRVAADLVGYGLRSHTSNVSVLLNNNVDQLLVSVTLSPGLLGLYTVASTMGDVVTVIGYSVAPVALPLVAARQSREQQRTRARGMVAATLVLSVVLALPLFAFAPQILDGVFGHPFHGATTSARLLVAGAVMFSVNRSLEAVLKAVGRPLAAGMAELVALGVTAASIAVLLPLFGLVGAASASILAAAASGMLLVRAAGRILALKPSDLLPLRPGYLRALLDLRAAPTIDADVPPEAEDPQLLA
jgi:O-antigen/teichoic acid export membrane protein